MKRVDRTGFLQAYLATLGWLTACKRDGLLKLLDALEADDFTGTPEAAYMLATVKHECADTWKPITERGAADYFLKYEAHTHLGQRLGNTEPGDGFLFRGRGYVQITGRVNYARMSDVVGLDLVKIPDLALMPVTAYTIMSTGMRRGLFTGKALGEYISTDLIDFVHARRIINGMDQAALIAGYASKFLTALEEHHGH